MINERPEGVSRDEIASLNSRIGAIETRLGSRITFLENSVRVLKERVENGGGGEEGWYGRRGGEGGEQMGGFMVDSSDVKDTKIKRGRTRRIVKEKLTKFQKMLESEVPVPMEFFDIRKGRTLKHIEILAPISICIYILCIITTGFALSYYLHATSVNTQTIISNTTLQGYECYPLQRVEATFYVDRDVELAPSCAGSDSCLKSESQPAVSGPQSIYFPSYEACTLNNPDQWNLTITRVNMSLSKHTYVGYQAPSIPQRVEVRGFGNPFSGYNYTSCVGPSQSLGGEPLVDFELTTRLQNHANSIRVPGKAYRTRYLRNLNPQPPSLEAPWCWCGADAEKPYVPLANGSWYLGPVGFGAPFHSLGMFCTPPLDSSFANAFTPTSKHNTYFISNNSIFNATGKGTSPCSFECAWPKLSEKEVKESMIRNMIVVSSYNSTGDLCAPWRDVPPYSCTRDETTRVNNIFAALSLSLGNVTLLYYVLVQSEKTPKRHY
ncbi:hypothetical protein AAMO2058_001478900 [Amorphochlora amoebiformis]